MRKLRFLTPVICATLMVAAVRIAPAASYQFTPLDFPGGNSARAVGFNNSGVAVGSLSFDAAPDAGFAWDDGTFDSFGFDPGAGVLPTNYNGIADDGTVVGFYDQGTGSSLVRTGFARDPDGILTTLPFAPGSTSTAPLDRNLSGATVGTISPGSNGASADAFLYTGGNDFDLVYAHPGSLRTQFNSINNAGVIVGRWRDDTATRGLIRSLDGTIATYELPGATNTHLFGINDLGQIVGYYTSESFGGTRGFLLENALDADVSNDVVTDIMFPGAGPGGTRAYAINDAGTIVGTYNGFGQGFVAVVPEPSSFALLAGAGLFGMAALRGVRNRN